MATGGGWIVVVNAEKVAVTGKKLDEKMYYRHSGYPGGLKERSLRGAGGSSAGRPTCCARRSRGCFPQPARAPAPEVEDLLQVGHPHEAQAPKPLDLS